MRTVASGHVGACVCAFRVCFLFAGELHHSAGECLSVRDNGRGRGGVMIFRSNDSEKTEWRLVVVLCLRCCVCSDNSTDLPVFFFQAYRVFARLPPRYGKNPIVCVRRCHACQQAYLVTPAITPRWLDSYRLKTAAVTIAEREWQLAKHDIGEFLTPAWANTEKQRAQYLARIGRVERRMGRVRV